MASRKRKVSMADVAQEAGVSAQTVSRVANGYEGVVPATRDRVVAAMTKLGYRPNAAARALKSGTFHNIGVIMFDLTSVGNTSTLAAISESAASYGYTVTVMAARSRTTASVTGALDRLQEMAVDGLILVMESAPDGNEGFTLPATDHLVVVDSALGEDHAIIDTDQAAGTRAAVEHLLALGHRTVHHITGPAHSYSAQRRERAWRAVLEESGRQVPEPAHGDWTAASGYTAGLTLLEDPGCTAVFCGNDEMALGLLHAASELGRRVPEDLSVVGFDDIPLASDFAPPLTTVHQDFAAMGRACMARLIRMIDTGVAERGTELVPASLVVRASTAPPPEH